MASPKKVVTAAVKRREAVKLRAHGLSIPAITKRVGYNSDKVTREAIRQELKSADREDLTQLLELEMMRLDKMTVTAMNAVQAGDLKGVDAGLRIMARRAAYTGLDATQRENDYSDVDRWLAGDAEVDFEIDINEVLGDELDDDEIPDDLD
ncbi:hypothetical protein [Rhodococcus sp. EPR-134]|uniref:hypothetical protein n=1 Tax=Rhodococcus sp. EPR-134 TaxID=1813675 RepID=UPI0007BB2F09|nr:hypothetical protein [Rhodococcus sp. EPR-134]KZF17315.1 hypothetical protein A2J01_25785 [Rhodococcus sp. EPR-134]